MVERAMRYLAGILSFSIFVLMFGCAQNGLKECFNDATCFETAARNCTPAHVMISGPNGSIEQRISGRINESGKCQYEIYQQGGPKDIMGVEVKKSGIACEMDDTLLGGFSAYRGGGNFSAYGVCTPLLRIT